MWRSVLAAVLILASTAPDDGRLPLPPLDDALKQRLTAVLDAHPATPEQYVVSKFRDHDVVFVGESHWIHEQTAFVGSLIPLLYASGVRTLATEFACRREQPLIDKLLAGRRYDEALARDIEFRFRPDWGFQEYLDLYHAAWALNRSLPRGAPKFRILALNDALDWSFVKRPEDRDNGTIMEKVWGGGGEHEWARVILEQVVARHEKVLVFCGLHHAITEYRLPIVDLKTQKFIRFGELRVGNYVYDAIGKRAITIALHAPWMSVPGQPMAYAAGGVLDALIAALPPARRRAGFDVAGTPFSELTAPSAYYACGYEHFTLATFCDGYVILGRLSDYTPATPVPGFVNEANLKRAQRTTSDPTLRSGSVAEFNRDIAETAEGARRRLARFW